MRARVGDALVGEGLEELAVEQHRVDVVADPDARGRLVGELLVDGPAERLEEGLGFRQILLQQIDENAADHGVFPFFSRGLPPLLRP